MTTLLLLLTGMAVLFAFTVAACIETAIRNADARAARRRHPSGGGRS
jgi:hypothetical protein